jgi:Tol biopolymer transport system component
MALVTVAGTVASARATAPGANGKIAFRRYLDASKTWGAVFTVDADGRGARQITHPETGVLDDQPSWSPDGRLIAFTRASDGALDHVYVVAPDGGEPTPVGPVCPQGATEQTCPDDHSASFSPDGKQLVLAQATGTIKTAPNGEQWIEHHSIVVADLDGGNRRVVYQGAPFSGDVDFPVYSPDGRQIVFEQIGSAFTTHPDDRAVFVIGADGSGLRQITPWAENDGDNPDWSPNGKWIIFHSHVDEPSVQSQFFLIHPDGSGRRRVTHFPQGTHVASAAFSPDGRFIVLAKGPEGGNIDVFTARVDGTHMRRVTRSNLWDSAPEWGPR